jgi:WD40 repeat protein
MSIPVKDARTVVPSLVFLADSKTLVFPESSNRIVLHDVEKDERVTVLEGHDKPVIALDVTPGGVLVSGDKGGTLKVWDLPK